MASPAAVRQLDSAVHGRRLKRGALFPRRALTDLFGGSVPVPDGASVIHLQFRRFAGCPVCSLHLQSFSRRRAELRAAGVREVLVFHSSAEELRRYEADLPFDVIPDRDRLLYLEFGVGSDPRALLRAGFIRHVPAMTVLRIRSLLEGRGPVFRIRGTGGHRSVPADVLITPDGRIADVKYGEHAFDQWTVDEVLARAGRIRRD